MKTQPMTRILGSMLTGVILLMAQSIKAQGTFIFNSTFDTGTDGWTLANVDGSAGYQQAGGHPGGCLFLLNGSFGAIPTASRSVSLSQGQTYVLSGDFAAQGKDPAVPSFLVSINGQPVYHAGLTSYSWQTFNITFTASMAASQITLASEVGGAQTYYSVDNLRLVAVPEPCSLWLGVAGLAGLIAARSREAPGTRRRDVRATSPRL